MHEIVEFKAENGALVTITPDDVVQYLCPTATVQEVGLFLELCKSQRLNPWTGEVYLIKYGDNPAQMQAGKETFTKRAAANPDYEGFEAGIIYADANRRVCKRAGSAYYPSVGETLIGGWCSVYVKGKRPFYDEVALQEYNTGRNLWKSKPATMIRKVALVHCLREAFPADFAGLYSEEEMQASASAKPNRADSSKPIAATVEPVTVPASAEQCELIGNKIDELASLRGVDFTTAYDAVFGSKALAAMGYEGADSLTEAQAETALGLLDRWISSTVEKATVSEDVPEYETE